MDIDALHSALLSLTILPEQIRVAREHITGRSADFAAFLDSMERDLRISKAALARELGFDVCRCCWPPEILTTDSAGLTACPTLTERPQRSHAPAKPKGARRSEPKVDPFVRIQKEKLLLLRDAVVDSITGVTKGNLRARTGGVEEASMAGDPADAGNDAADCDFALCLLSQEHDALNEIDQALRRIERGRYGVCEISGKRIPRARLKAIPFARYTVECQAQLEDRRATRKTRPQPLSIFSCETEERLDDPGEMSPPNESSSAISRRIALLESPGSAFHSRLAVV